jgi:ATP-dependent DNA helicase RecQ
MAWCWIPLSNARIAALRKPSGFAIDGPLPKGAVLLIDDIVDSKWTLTVIAALLRQAGSGPVFPFA